MLQGDSAAVKQTTDCDTKGFLLDNPYGFIEDLRLVNRPHQKITKDDRELYIGLMSGTSMDALDAVLADFRQDKPVVVGSVSEPLPSRLRTQLLSLCHPGDNELERLCRADLEWARLAATVVKKLLNDSETPACLVRAIGSHGQTIRHLPALGTSIQTGDPNLIAEQTGIATVADFRRRDMAAGGEGAPLAPAFHEAMFRQPSLSRVLVNIGGIANITVLPGAQERPVTGFDTGPGNTLLDGWCFRHKRLPYDAGGNWAATATPDAALLQALLSDPFFALSPPRSTGREYFHLGWLDAALARIGKEGLAAATVQATLVELTACTLAQAIETYAPDCQQVYLCGGGVFNHRLVARIRARLPGCHIADTGALGLDPRWVEATAFAWLARRACLGQPGNLPAVTNATGFRVLGGVYPGRHPCP
ncbi:MAG: anhydro-N-acetylmuramic acid kinase [Kistimonas sp.]|nr:anhydro-N-acetylmuramic acid kinase [Kistimonas sp.]